MKIKSLAFFLCVLMMVPCFGSASSLPEEMLAVHPAEFPADKKYPVFSGPGTEYARLGNGKASVSTNDWIDVFGYDSGWLMIRYGLSDTQTRIGWISQEEAGDFSVPDIGYFWEWHYMRTLWDIFLTDDPFLSLAESALLPAGTPVYRLDSFGGWAYVDTSLSGGTPMRGFVPLSALESAPVPYENNPAFAGAAAFLSDAGISFTVSGMHDNDLYFALENGGSASYYHYSDGYSVYETGNWRFQDASDEDVALFLNANLNVLCQVEAGQAPEEHLHPEYHADQGLGQWNIDATISNGFLGLERFGQQGVDVLLHQLSLHDGNDALNSLRARLASRLLGKLDITPVDPALGCAWYDALTLSIQDALPPVDASLYVDDPVLAQATQALIAHFDEEKSSWDGWLDVDSEKTRNLVSLSVHQMKETENELVLWATVSESQFALYDGYRAQSLSGSWIPSRVTLEKDENGNWALKELLRAEDGTRYAPSIIEFCEGDQKLADAMMGDETRDLWQCFETYLKKNGFGDVEVIPY